ncbi:hypothetical protein [Amaricoccus solimangrovi]|uniref:Uncharacterized protein n=1 Tax=Amaricoccus solimangrovi TaxID=2589815 RepID=A0A501X1C9_9RHOB|nr:hypothetical protein [Amaricoccus solimangrovi]TPE53746.1 hypothetical protein FJM51_01490 [Amaricoccus solimangrovi]
MALGLAAALVAVLALAWIFPPIRYFAPAVPGDTERAPEAPKRPALVPGGPVISGDAARPILPRLGPPPAPEAARPAPPVRDAAGNTPSLVPLPPPPD